MQFNSMLHDITENEQSSGDMLVVLEKYFMTHMAHLESVLTGDYCDLAAVKARKKMLNLTVKSVQLAKKMFANMRGDWEEILRHERCELCTWSPPTQSKTKTEQEGTTFAAAEADKRPRP